ERRPPGTCLRSGGSGRGGAGERRARAAGPSAEERVRGARRRIRPAALGAHARRPILPVQPAGAAVPTIRRGTAPAGGDVAVREPGHGLLGAAAAAGRARRDHLDSAGACLSPWARPPEWVAPCNRQVLTVVGRSEERRVGKECYQPCRSRWSPHHKKKKKKYAHTGDCRRPTSTPEWVARSR